MKLLNYRVTILLMVNRLLFNMKKLYVLKTILRLEQRETTKIGKIMEFFGGVSMTQAIRRLIRDKKIN